MSTASWLAALLLPILLYGVRGDTLTAGGCENLADGSYSFGCSQDFFACSGGAAYAQSCHHGLVFNSENTMCDYPENVAACSLQNEEPRDLIHDLPHHQPDPQAVPIPSVPVQTQGDPMMVQLPPVPNSMGSVQPSTNFAQPLPAPSAPLTALLTPNEVLPLNPMLNNQQQPFFQQAPQPSPMNIFQPPAPIPPVQQQMVQNDVQQPDCSNLDDGLYSLGCDQKFLQCSNRFGHIHQCQDGLFFDGIGLACDYKHLVLACQGSQSTGNDQQFSSQHSPDWNQPQMVESHQPQPGHDQIAPSNQQYFEPIPVEETNKWSSEEIEEKIPQVPQELAQNGYQPAPQAPQNPPVQPEGQYQPEPVQPAEQPMTENWYKPPPAPSVPQAPTEANKPDCLNRPDGSYSLDCNRAYLVCVYGTAHSQQCPQGLVFNQETILCDYPENVPACSGEPIIPPPPQAVPLNPQNPRPAWVEEKPVQQVEQYPPLPPPQAPTEPIQPAKPAQYGGLGETQQPSDCSNRPDGSYSLGCNGAYLVCVYGQQHPQQCPQGLVFNQEEMICDHRENIPSCSSEPSIPPPPQAVPLNPQNPPPTWVQEKPVQQTEQYAAPPPPQAPTQPTQPAKPPQYGSLKEQQSSDCSDRPDGSYSLGCNGAYLVCVYGTAHSQQCPQGLVFSEAKMACDHLENVPSCTGQPSIPPPPQAVPLKPQSPPPTWVAEKPVQKVEQYPAPPPPQAPQAPPPPPPNWVPEKPAAPVEQYPPHPAPQAPPTWIPEKPVAPVEQYPAPPPPQAPPTRLPEKPVAPVQQYQSPPTTQAPPPAWVPEKPTPPPAPAPSPYQPAWTPQQPAPQQPLLDAPQQTTAECLNKPDGAYSMGCIEDYLVCFMGRSHVQKCPAGIVFNEEINACDHRENVPACGGQQSQPPAQAQPIAKISSYRRTWTPPQTAPPVQPAQDIPQIQSSPECSNKPDGAHSLGCVGDYLVCFMGRAHVQKCPSGTVYNQAINACDHRENAPACGGQQPQPPALAQPTPKNPSYQPTWTPPQPASPSQPSMDTTPIQFSPECLDRQDGAYSLGCNEGYLVCVHGMAHLQKCPAGTIYSQALNACDQRENVPACAGQQSPPPAQAQPILQNPSYQPTWTPQQPVSPPQPSLDTTQIRSSPECLNRPDGAYSLGCNEGYLVCVHGAAHPQRCPKGIVFNQDTNSCDHRENVPSCGGQQQPQQPVQAQPLPQNPSYQPTWTSQPASPPQPSLDTTQIQSSPECLDRQDGAYSLGCHEGYLVCVHGTAHSQRCPAGTIYSQAINACDHRENVAACGGPQQQPHIQAPIPPPVVNQQIAQQQPLGLPLAPSLPQQQFTQPGTQPDCSRGDGSFSLGCGSDYVTCSNGFAHAQKCPAGLSFNQATIACDHPENVPACGGANPAIQNAAPIAPTYQLPAQNPAVPPQILAQNPPAFQFMPPPMLGPLFKGNCQAGQLYPRGECLDTYLRCSNGVNFQQLTCAQGQRFDPVRLICRPMHEVPTCLQREDQEPIYINNGATGKDLVVKEAVDADIILNPHRDDDHHFRHHHHHKHHHDRHHHHHHEWSQGDLVGSFENDDDDHVADIFGNGHHRNPIGKLVEFGGFYVKSRSHHKHHRKHGHHHRHGHKHSSEERMTFRSTDAFEGRKIPKVLSNPFYGDHRRRTAELEDILDKKSGRLTDSIFKFFPAHKRHHKRHHKERDSHSHEHKHKKHDRDESDDHDEDMKEDQVEKIDVKEKKDLRIEMDKTPKKLNAQEADIEGSGQEE